MLIRKFEKKQNKRFMMPQSENPIITGGNMNHGIFAIIVFGESRYGEKNRGEISKIIRTFGKNFIVGSEGKYYGNQI